MRTVFSKQYGTPAVVAEKDDTAADIIEQCQKIGAVYEEEPGDELFVVVLRESVGPELWTHRALKGSMS